MIKRPLIPAILTYVAVSFFCCARITAADHPNVLLILVDDLKPALGCYGDPVAKTPNIDALAAKAMRFELAYCNQAVCAPSRFTLMLGSHSTSTGLYGLDSQLREVIPNAVTMPQYFARHGAYRTESLGKVFHIGHGNHGDPQSFSVPHFHDKVIEYLDPASTDGGRLTREEAFFTNQKLDDIKSLPRGAAFESLDVADTKYADGRVAAETVKRLRAARERRVEDGTPFFIAAGFARPHLPFSAPQQYWNLYDPASLPMPRFEDLPTGAPSVAGKRGGEISNYEPVPTDRHTRFSNELKRTLIHGYYASTSFVDAQIGKVIDELDRLDLTDNTIVVLWGDHGFHLGDLGIWTKHTNYEQANRIPLLISAPGVTKPGSSTKQLAETVDIFPTLAELAGLPVPEGPQPIDGVNLVPVLRNPTERVRDHAFHAYPRQKLGRAIRTQQHRLVEWQDFGEPSDSIEYELYDYEADPWETRNLAAEKPDIVAALKRTLAMYPQAVARNRRRDHNTDAKQPNPKSDSGTRAEHPNIVLVFIDDMGWGDFSCFGNMDAKTPQIDRLAREGMRFEQFYVNSPICSPSRTAISTGQYPQRWRITSYLSNRDHNHQRGMSQWLDPRAPMLARSLQHAGYATGHFGKWHMGGQRNVDDAPPITEYGFDTSLTNFEGMGPKLLPLVLKPGQPKPGKIWSDAERLGEGFKWMLRSEITGGFVDAAIPFIQKANAADKPFYINVWPDDVHNPFWPPVDKWADGKRGLYLSVLQEMDRQRGRLFDVIREDEQLRENTLVLVCSDNGPEPGAGSAGPLRGFKTHLYEGGIRSSLVVWGPGLVTKRNHVDRDSVFSAIDLVPTLLSLTGTPKPDEVNFDGESLVNTIRGQGGSRQAPIFFRRPPDRDSFYGVKDLPDLAMRDGKWKLLCEYDGSDPQLYDLDSDRAETTNLATQQHELVAKMTKVVVAWHQSMPPDNGTTFQPVVSRQLKDRK